MTSEDISGRLITGVLSAIFTGVFVYLAGLWIANPMYPHEPGFYVQLRYVTVALALLAGGGVATFPRGS